MKLMKNDKAEKTLKVENMDDLWYLSNIVDIGDLVKGKTVRKIKIGESSDRNVKIIKKTVFIEIRVEKIEFSKTSNTLRVLGVITQAGQDIQKGEHHSFKLGENSIITIKKERWLKFQLDKLKDACSDKIASMVIVVHDREEAYFALMKKYGYEILGHIEGDVQKKDEEKRVTKNFYSEIITKVSDYVGKYDVKTIILASPAFWKDELMKSLKDDDLKKKIIFATCSTVGKTAINEVLKRDEVKKALHEDRITKEVNIIEELLSEIKKNELAVYGIKDVKNAVDAGAVKDLLVCDSLIQTKRDDGSFFELDSIMKNADSVKANIMIISSDHDGGKKLNGLGGIAGILRYKLNY